MKPIKGPDLACNSLSYDPSAHEGEHIPDAAMKFLLRTSEGFGGMKTSRGNGNRPWLARRLSGTQFVKTMAQSRASLGFRGGKAAS